MLLCLSVVLCCCLAFLNFSWSDLFYVWFLQEVDMFELDHLDYKTVAQYPYLEGDRFKQIFLYHSQR